VQTPTAVPSHCSPHAGWYTPSPQCAGGHVVEVVVVVVVVVAHPPAVHASQQLVKIPTHAVAPGGAAQCAASRLILHFVPLAFVTQQVTAPACFPQVECAAHRLTAPTQFLLTSACCAFCAAQNT
jgi:hypothetical protein